MLSLKELLARIRGQVTLTSFSSRISRRHGDSRDNATASDAHVDDPQTPRDPRYRLPGLDGLRAIGAIAVLAYHLIPHYVPGGFTGVDVFFVLSGFLITALLIHHQDKTGHLGVRGFWLKRIRRLFPAVFATTVIMIPIAALVSTDLLVGVRRQFIGSLTFTYIWVQIAQGTSYFETQVPELLRNMWSLAVEQQFYVFWPLLLAPILMLPYRWRACGPALLASASILDMVILSRAGADVSRIYEGTDTHVFGLMLGAMIALIAPHPMRALTPRERVAHPHQHIALRGWAAWAGLALIVVCFFIVDDAAGWTYPWGLLLCSLGCVLLIQGMLDTVSGTPGPGRLLAQILEVKPLVWLGERSYSIYLWHWPLVVILRMAFPQLPVWWMALLVCVLALIIATLSYHFIETPMRYHGIIATLKVWFGLDGTPAEATTQKQEATEHQGEDLDEGNASESANAGASTSERPLS